MTEQEIKAYIDQKFADTFKKVRIPELPENTDDLSGEDRLPIWIKGVNKTKWESLHDLKQFFELGEGGTIPADAAAKGVYPFDVSPVQAGSNTISFPQLAGKNFLVAIEGRPLLDDEFEVLNSGGFTVLIPGYKFEEGQRVSLHFAEPIPGNTTAAGGATIKGKIRVDTSIVLTSGDAFKLIQIRGVNAFLTVTLPSVASFPEHGLLYLEAQIQNQKQQTIQPQGGQSIYMNGTSWEKLFIAPGEVMVLYRDEAGWIVVNDFGMIIREIGTVCPSYGAKLNELELTGQLVSRTEYPRLWQWVNTTGQSLVNDGSWSGHKGLFSRGDGSTTFRLPDMRGMFVRGIKDVDTERAYNFPGGYQGEKIKNFLPDTAHIRVMKMDNQGTLTSAGDGTNPSGKEPNLLSSEPIKTELLGSETRPENIGLKWVIKC